MKYTLRYACTKMSNVLNASFTGQGLQCAPVDCSLMIYVPKAHYAEGYNDTMRIFSVKVS